MYTVLKFLTLMDIFYAKSKILRKLSEATMHISLKSMFFMVTLTKISKKLCVYPTV